MEFRKTQVEEFIDKVKEVSKMTGVIPDAAGQLQETDDYIDNVIIEIEENIIDLTAARATLLNYLNHKVSKGSGEQYNRMRLEFLKINNWVRSIEIEVLGKPAFDETLPNPDTAEPTVNASEIQAVQQEFPPGFTAFTNEQAARITEMHARVTTGMLEEHQRRIDDEDYDPFSKDPEQSEEDWERRFIAKDCEAKIYNLAHFIAIDNAFFNMDLMFLIQVVFYQKNYDLINLHLLKRINELVDEDVITDIDASEARLSVLLMAVNMFTEKNKDIEKEQYNPVELSFNQRKELQFTMECFGSKVTMIPADYMEAMQLIFIKMGGLRPLKSYELMILKDFNVANLGKHNDIEYYQKVLNTVAKVYVSKGFLDTGRALAEALAVPEVSD